MTLHGPRRPEVETLHEYIDRIVSSAPAPTPEDCRHIASLLRLGASAGGARNVA